MIDEFVYGNGESIYLYKYSNGFTAELKHVSSIMYKLESVNSYNIICVKNHLCENILFSLNCWLVYS